MPRELCLPVLRLSPLGISTGSGLVKSSLRLVQDSLSRRDRRIGAFDLFLRFGGSQLKPAPHTLGSPSAADLFSAGSISPLKILDLMLHPRVGALFQSAQVGLPATHLLEHPVLGAISAGWGIIRNNACRSPKFGQLRILLGQARAQLGQLVARRASSRALGRA